MYRQNRINPLDADYQRILWRILPGLPSIDFRLLTLSYGEKPAPYIAIRVIHQLVEDEGEAFPIVSIILEENTFIDDALFGGHSLELAMTARNEVNSLLAKGHFQARKWMSNVPSLLKGINPADHGLAWTAPSHEHEGLKILD